MNKQPWAWQSTKAIRTIAGKNSGYANG